MRKTAMEVRNMEEFTKSKPQMIALHKRIKHQYVRSVVVVCLNMLVVEYFRLESFKQDKRHHTPALADGAV